MLSVAKQLLYFFNKIQQMLRCAQHDRLISSTCLVGLAPKVASVEVQPAKDQKCYEQTQHVVENKYVI
jgi:hypothetical protein